MDHSSFIYSPFRKLHFVNILFPLNNPHLYKSSKQIAEQLAQISGDKTKQHKLNWIAGYVKHEIS